MSASAKARDASPLVKLGAGVVVAFREDEFGDGLGACGGVDTDQKASEGEFSPYMAARSQFCLPHIRTGRAGAPRLRFTRFPPGSQALLCCRTRRHNRRDCR